MRTRLFRDPRERMRSAAKIYFCAQCEIKSALAGFPASHLCPSCHGKPGPEIGPMLCEAKATSAQALPMPLAYLASRL